MKRLIEQSAVFLGLVLSGVGLRLYFQEIPNFAPVAAVALFAGFFFRTRSLAVLAPIAIMAISDLFLGRYHPLLMITVYAFLTIPVCVGRPLRARLNKAGAIPSTICVAGFSLGSSLAFFAATNLMTWLVTPWYPRTVAGLLECYASAVPFFRFTLGGDLFFAALLFGGYAVIGHLVSRPATELSSAQT